MSRGRERHDVVVVGAGSAGCVLAARLSDEPDRTVLLLEAGPVPVDAASVPDALRDERSFPLEHLWRYEGFHAVGDVVPASIVRGRVAGGSGAVNGMLWQRGLPEDHDGWGVDGWRDVDLRPVFGRLEDDRDAAGAHPARGPVPLHRAPRADWSSAHAAFHDALRDLGAPANPDLLRAEHEGVGAYVRNASGGVRMSAAVTHLAPVLARPNLRVRGDVPVARVLVEDGRAVGVEVLEDGRPRRIDAGEVVLCAGAVETPQLLTHSGIGGADRLRALGLPVVADLPGVGGNLTDHPSVVVTVRLHQRVRDWDLRCLVGDVATSSHARARGRRSDLQTLVMSGPWVGNTAGHLPRATDPSVVDLVLNPILYAPESVGRVEVVDVDPSVRPRIHYAYLHPAADRERLREALRRTGDVLAHPAFRAIVADDAGAPDARTLEDDDRLDAWMGTALQSTYHGCGTCRTGRADAEGTVVDERCRVLGVSGLRVADLSVVPRVPAAPTNATAMVVGERVAGWM